MDIINLETKILPVLEKLLPFVSTSNSRKFTRGILIRGSCAYATNSMTLIEHKITHSFPVDVQISYLTAKRMIKNGKEPISYHVDSKFITFGYQGNKFVKSILCDEKWPDVSKLLSRVTNQKKVHHDLFKGIKDLYPSNDIHGPVYFTPFGMTKHKDARDKCVKIDGIPVVGVYSAMQLLSLRGLANKIDFDTYPDPCMFSGDDIRGAIIGVFQ